MTDVERVAELERRIAEPLTDHPRALVGLTHRSFVHEGRTGEVEDNERLEFLGDAVIDLAISHRLMEGFPRLSEGELSKLRAVLVNEEALARVAGALGLGELLRLGRGEEQTGGRSRPSVLANSLEALVAVIYLDLGLAGIFRFIDRFFATSLAEAAAGTTPLDYKTVVQELAQARHKVTPRYRVVSQSGPDHQRVFKVEVSVAGEVLGEGTGRSKKEAEQAAARTAHAKLLAPEGLPDLDRPPGETHFQGGVAEDPRPAEHKEPIR
jgi:ribonuclease III